MATVTWVAMSSEAVCFEAREIAVTASRLPPVRRCRPLASQRAHFAGGSAVGCSNLVTALPPKVQYC
jgi:hypothetical protein